MPKEIDVDEIRALVTRSVQLVEVLPQTEFEEEHLPGAINIPLKKMNEHGVGVLDRDKPVIVYCWDYQ